VSIGLVAAALWPVVRNPRDDGFPLSTYPMFATARPTTLVMSYPLGETAEGTVSLRPRLIGSPEVLQARAIVERAVAKGRTALAALCARIAERVATDDGFRGVTAIRIVSGTHDAIEFLTRDQRGPERLLVRCEVRR
jgi:hypothetical protein